MDCGHILGDGNEEITCKCSTCGNIIAGNLDYFVSENSNENFKCDEERLQQTKKPLRLRLSEWSIRDSNP